MDRQHHWVKYTHQAVDVIVDLDGHPFSVETPGAPIGEVTGCDHCGVPLTPDYLNQPCIPQEVALPAAS